MAFYIEIARIHTDRVRMRTPIYELVQRTEPSLSSLLDFDRYYIASVLIDDVDLGTAVLFFSHPEPRWGIRSRPQGNEFLAHKVFDDMTIMGIIQILKSDEFTL